MDIRLNDWRIDYRKNPVPTALFHWIAEKDGGFVSASSLLEVVRKIAEHDNLKLNLNDRYSGIAFVVCRDGLLTSSHMVHGYNDSTYVSVWCDELGEHIREPFEKSKLEHMAMSMPEGVYWKINSRPMD